MENILDACISTPVVHEGLIPCLFFSFFKGCEKWKYPYLLRLPIYVECFSSIIDYVQNLTGKNTTDYLSNYLLNPLIFESVKFLNFIVQKTDSIETCNETRFPE